MGPSTEGKERGHKDRDTGTLGERHRYENYKFIENQKKKAGERRGKQIIYMERYRSGEPQELWGKRWRFSGIENKK